MNMMILILTGLLGLCLGSFLQVVIGRFSPNKTTTQYLYDITFKRSSCPHCQTKLSFLSLIPLISWGWQRAKCRHCLQSIAWHYPAIELTSALYCVAIIAFYGLSNQSLLFIIFGSYLLILTIIDYQYLLLPDCFTYSLLFIGLILAMNNINNTLSLSEAFRGSILGYILLWLPATIYRLLKKQVGLGGGDIKLSSALGAWLGYYYLPVLLIIASLMGIVYFFISGQLKKQPIKQTIIPFGPSLLMAGYIILIYR